MNGSLSEGAQRPEAPPWEPLARFGGRRGYSDPVSAWRAIEGESSLYGRRPSRVSAELKSGLTRRGVIYEYVRAHPGSHVREMARELRLATGDLHYHLFWLEKHGFVKTRKSGFYRFVFPAMVFGDEQEVLLGVLSKETPREILLCLLLDTLTQSDLARSLGYSQPTISWHMDRLVQLGVVSRRKAGAELIYDVTADRGDVLAFVKAYHPQVWKSWAGRIGHLVANAEGVERSSDGWSLQGARPMAPAVVELIGKR